MQSTSTVVPPDFSLATSPSAGGRRGGVLGVLDILPPLLFIPHPSHAASSPFPFSVSSTYSYFFFFFFLFLALFLIYFGCVIYYPAVLVERPVLLPGALPVGCTCFSVSSIMRTSNNVPEEKSPEREREKKKEEHVAK